jgi:hypothetical protein
MARAIGDSMKINFMGPADIHPVLTLPGLNPVERDDRWSQQSDCHQLKATMAWLEMGSDKDYEDTLQRSLHSHKAFLSHEPGVRMMDRLHAYSYFLEALLPSLDRDDAREALNDGLERASIALRKLRSVFERADVCAQILRVRILAAHLAGISLDEAAASEEASWAAAYQFLQDASIGCAGGFCFGQRDGKWTEYVNPVSTAFCLQALAMWDDHCRGRRFVHWRDLV